MGTGRTAVLVAAATFMMLGGCAANEPRAILSAPELGAMIRVEVEQIAPERADDTVVAALQP